MFYRPIFFANHRFLRLSTALVMVCIPLFIPVAVLKRTRCSIPTSLLACMWLGACA